MANPNSRRTKKSDKGKHLNYMGGNSWDIDNPILRLRVAASSSFFGEPAYYVDGDSKPRGKTDAHASHTRSLSTSQIKHLRDTLNAVDPKEWRGMTTRQLMESAIDDALNYSPRATLEFAVELRQEDNIRLTPQVIMVRAAMHDSIKGSGMIREFAPKIMGRLDEVMSQIAYFEDITGACRNIPSSLKRAWADRIQIASDYELAKYRMEGRKVSLYDAVNICHPKSNENIDALMKGNLKLSTDGNRQTWESIRSGGGSWNDAIQVMGHMALLRNLRNLENAGVLNSDTLQKLVDGAEKGRQLPFRYFSAYKNVPENPRLLDAIEEAMEVSLGNLPQLSGKTICLVDNSGSAQGSKVSSMSSMSTAEVGNLMGVLTAKVSDEGYVGVFGDKLKTIPIRRRDGVISQLEKINKAGDSIGMGTENGIWLFLNGAIQKDEHWDNIFIYSDMQAGHGGLYGTNRSVYSNYTWEHSHIDVAKLIAEYRRKVNPNVNVFMVQTAGYQDTLVPEFYDRTYILGGWSDKIIHFASRMINMRNGQ